MAVLQPGHRSRQFTANLSMKDMRKLIALAAALLPILLVPQIVEARDKRAIDFDDVERRHGGLTYEIGSDVPLSGLVREIYSRKQKKSEVHFVDGKRDGLSTRWWPNGEKQFEGNFEAGRPVGLQTDYYQNGNKKTEKTLVKGLPDGIVTTWHANGNMARQETMVNGVRHGLVVAWYDDGRKKAEENWVNGQDKLEGISNEWGNEGRVYIEGNYQSGNFTGKKLGWSENSLSYEEIFIDGERVEYAETLGREYANGQIRGEQRWINGKRQETFWYENGQRETLNTIGGKTEDGQWTEWHENGQKRREFTRAFGLTEGLVTDWYENGQKKAEVNVLHGDRNGIHTEWFEDGRVKSEINYIAGVPEDQVVEPGPPPPRNPEVTGSGLDVTYGMHRGSIRFWNTAIQSVSDGTFSGNTAVVAPGAKVRMTGDWQIGPVTNPSDCPGCNVQIYLAWVPDAMARGAWPPNDYLWYGMAQSVKANNEPGGTFDWTTQAPTLPGFYYVGKGQTLDYSFKRKTQGILGVTTNGPATEKAASFEIEVRANAAK